MTEMSTAAGPGYAPQKDQLLKRLRRIEGQVRGIAGMVDADRYCIDVLQQVSAAKAGLDKVALGLLEDHVATCMTTGASDAARTQELTEELVIAITRLVRS